MAIKFRDVVTNASDDAVTLEFKAASNAEEVKAFLEANMGMELEIILATTDEVGKATGEKGTGKGNLSSCASGSYWKPKA